MSSTEVLTNGMIVEHTDNLTDYKTKMEGCFQEKQYPEAIEIATELLRSEPDNVSAISILGRSYSATRKDNRALTYLRQFVALCPDNLDGHVLLADLHQRMRRLDLAVVSYERAISLQPSLVRIYIPYVFVLQRLNRREDANSALEIALNFQPNNAMLLYLSGQSARRDKDYKKATMLLERSLGNNPPATYLHLIHGEFCKVHEAMKNFQEAFAENCTAQRLASQSDSARRMDTESIDRVISESDGFFSQQETNQWRNTHFTDNFNPVFLVGFPRSGTTLMEQVCHAHPEIATTDERLVLKQQALRLQQLLKWEASYPRDLNQIRYGELCYLRRWYMDEMIRQVPKVRDARRMVDKNPMNIILLGLVNRVFPQSRIIVMLRDPRDVVLSCFFQIFAPNPETINFFTLESTARYYAQVMGQYLRSRDLYSLDILEVRYEELVKDFELEARKAIEFVGESWDDQVLSYHEIPQAVISTPSFEGINQPVYNKSVAKWRNYEEHFADCHEILAPFVKAFGYQP